MSPENTISIVTAVIIIFITAKFLFSLQRSPDYGLRQRKKRIDLKTNFSFTSGRIVLKSMAEEDIEKMRLLRNKNRLYFIHSEEITEEAQKQWYEAYLLRDDDYLFSVFYQEKWVGAVSIYHVDQKQDKAEFGRLMIDRTAASVGGLGVDATQAACQIALEQLGIHTVVLEVYEDNEAAKITYQKAGFVSTGTICDKAGQKVIQMELQQ